jgi:CheY-like chemotaxis protein
MEADIKGFAESAKGFTKSPLGIIALFIVLVYGFAALAVTFGDNLSEHITPLIYFLVFFPVIVFAGFLWLVSKHHDKIYGPSDFRDEENFFRNKMSTVASLSAAAAKQQPDSFNNSETAHQQLNTIIDMVTKTQTQKTSRKIERWKNKILWVDDRPENNVYERRAFESQGIEFTLALSTNEALEILSSNKYAAIISDMGRKEGPQEGYVLLEKLRTSGDNTPFFIYAGSDSSEHRRMALQHGAQGSTNKAQDLYEMVMNRIMND